MNTKITNSLAIMMLLLFLASGYPLYTTVDSIHAFVIVALLIIIGINSLKEFIILNEFKCFKLYKWVQLCTTLIITPIISVILYTLPNAKNMLWLIIIMWFVVLIAIKFLFMDARKFAAFITTKK